MNAGISKRRKVLGVTVQVPVIVDYDEGTGVVVSRFPWWSSLMTSVAARLARRYERQARG